jgi:hypothetical protein
MRVLRFLTALIILLSPTAQAGTANSPEICQRMALSLIGSFDVNQSESKEQLIQFAEMCMPESELNKHPNGFQTLPLMRNGRNTATTQIRV